MNLWINRFDNWQLSKMQHMEPGRCGGSFEGRGTKLYRVSGGSASKRWWPNDKFGHPHGLDTSMCIWYVGQVFLKYQLEGVFWSFQIFQSQPFMVILCNIVYYWVYDMYGYMIICIYIHTPHTVFCLMLGCRDMSQLPPKEYEDRA